jgi:hypothetical protein
MSPKRPAYYHGGKSVKQALFAKQDTFVEIAKSQVTK